MTDSCQRYNELHLGPPLPLGSPVGPHAQTNAPIQENRRRLRPAVQRPAASDGWGWLGLQQLSCRRLLSGRTPKRPQSPMRAPGGLGRRTVYWERQVGPRPRFHNPGSDVIQDPGSLCRSPGMGMVRAGGSLGHPKRRPALTGRSPLDSTSPARACLCIQKVKRSRYKTGDGVTLPPPAPNLPAKPFSGPPGRDSPRRCRSAAERPPRAAPSIAARSQPRAAPELETGCAPARARARLGNSSRAHHLSLQQLLSRDSRASTEAQLCTLREKEGPGRPYTLQELLRGAKFQTLGRIRLWAGTTRGQEQVENVEEEIGYGV